jgi:hypothetical protein
MKPGSCRSCASALVLCLVFLPLACGKNKHAADDDGAGASGGRGGNAGNGAAAGSSSMPSDRCFECDDPTDCSTNFCNRIGSSDFLELIGQPLPATGVCSAPGDVGKCGCFVGYVDGGTLCVGTGCSGTPVTLCDHLSGDDFGGAGGSGSTGGTGGVAPNGGAAGSGRGGAGGMGGGLAADRLGTACEDDADCGPSLLCVTSDALSGSGPALGLCTTPCQTDDECRSLEAGAYCYPLASGANYCIEGCRTGSPAWMRTIAVPISCATRTRINART